MRLLSSVFISAAVVLAAPSVPATTFTVTGTLQTGTLSGTVDIDTVNGGYRSSAIVFSLPGGIQDPFSTIDSQGIELTGAGFFEDTLGTDDGRADRLFLTLILPGFNPYTTQPLQGYGGGPLCSTSTPICSSGSRSAISFVNLAGVTTPDELTTGSLTPLATTPEPAPCLLLLTGLLGLALAHSRSIRRSRRSLVS